MFSHVAFTFLPFRVSNLFRVYMASPMCLGSSASSFLSSETSPLPPT